MKMCYLHWKELRNAKKKRWKMCILYCKFLKNLEKCRFWTLNPSHFGATDPLGFKYSFEIKI